MPENLIVNAKTDLTTLIISFIFHINVIDYGNVSVFSIKQEFFRG